MRYILWDFDNTLAHRPGLWSQCLADLVNVLYPSQLAVKEHFSPYLSSGFPWHSPELSHHHLVSSDVWWNSLLPLFQQALKKGADINVKDSQLLAQRVRFEYTNPERWEVFSDTHNALETLSNAGWDHIILSNHVPELEALVEALGLAKHFKAIHTSALLGYEKPHANAFSSAVEDIRFNAERIVMVGDSFAADYVGAISAGLEALLVRNTHPDCPNAFPDLAKLTNFLTNPSNIS